SCVNDKRFPFKKTVEQMVAQNPDLVFFSGDQLYQTNAGGEVIEAESEADLLPAMKSYLAKWRMFGLTFRDLMKDRPSVIITDDHDVYARDLWGNGGKRMTGGRTDGGYLDLAWVNAVERVQMWILPDAANPGPWGDGILGYFTSMDFGGVSFAILEDRKFKSPPTDILKKAVDDPRSKKPNTTLEVIMDPTFDTRTLDAPGLNLLGDAQETFLRDWAEGVRRSGKLAAVLHQSPFVNVGNYQRTFGDMDSNGWPPTARKHALQAAAPSQAILISGDLHYGTILQHGIEDWGDGPWCYSLPPFGSGQGRVWDPVEPPQGGAVPGMPGSGNHFDRFGNKLTLVAKADGYVGYGMVLFDKDSRDITLQFHPMDPNTREPIDVDVPGWPKRIRVE
ncbi:MAG: alkaline phosphatase D family protein, partial [Verrucomicrobiae bacterium]|nr:alkaline phosphatase D family protein [Verrucomicrobiae bacterium]